MFFFQDCLWHAGDENEGPGWYHSCKCWNWRSLIQNTTIFMPQNEIEKCHWVYSVHNSKVINKMIDSPRQSWYLYVLRWLATQTRKELLLILLSIFWNVVHVIVFNISNEICSWYCCILFWWDWITSSPEYMYTYSSGLLHSYWGHYVISLAPVK